MKKAYEEPILKIRNYSLPTGNVVMTSDPNANSESSSGVDLTDGDDYTYFK